MNDISFKTTVNFDTKIITKAYENKMKKAQQVFDACVLRDSNYFVPKETGTLEKSSIKTTKIGSGVVRWQTSYARAQYYGENFDHSKQRNPNAHAKWFELAKALWLKNWERVVNEYIKRK